MVRTAYFQFSSMKWHSHLNLYSKRFGTKNLQCKFWPALSCHYVALWFFQDPAVLQAISGQQPESQIADATNTSPAATTATLSTPQSQVMGFILCILDFERSTKKRIGTITRFYFHNFGRPRTQYDLPGYSCAMQMPFIAKCMLQISSLTYCTMVCKYYLHLFVFSFVLF